MTQQQKKQPNFLLIVADDLGFSDVGAFGGEISTPNIDKLAANGLRLNQFYAAAACSPTRSMLLTGTDNHIAGLGQMFETISRTDVYIGKPGHEGHLNDKVAALPEILGTGGYSTYLSGKWHLGLLPENFPKARGFQKSFALLPGCANHYAWEPQLDEEGENNLAPFLKGTVTALHAEDGEYVKDVPDDYYSSDFFTDKIIDYIKQHKSANEESGNPFFAYLPFTAPHWPLQAPKEIVQKYKGLYDEGPAKLREKRLEAQKRLGIIPKEVEPHPVIAPEASDWANLTDIQRQKSARSMEVFAAMVDRLDWNVGRVLETVKSLGYEDDTIVVFLSDNGAEGASWEAIPVMGPNIEKHLEKYYDNSLENIGNYNSYVWYGPRWAQAATAPSKLYKAFSSEGGIHVPLIISHPDLDPKLKGSISNVFTTVMDIVPTFLDFAGIPQPNPESFLGRKVAPIRGKSWKKFLEDSESVTKIHDKDDTVGWELHGHGALRKGDWKITFLTKPIVDDTWRLYNIKSDPGETKDLAQQLPEKLNELLAEWEKYTQETGVVGLGPDLKDIPVNEIDDETRWMKYESVNSHDISKRYKLNKVSA